MTRTADIHKEVEFFDHFEEVHGDYDVLGETAYRRLLNRFAALVRPKSGERCVDLGCGTGAFTRRLAEFELEILGIDVSPRSIERARERGPGQKYEAQDIMATSLPDDSMDIAVFSGVLHHLPTAADQGGRVARKLSRSAFRGAALWLRSARGESEYVAVS